MLEAFLTTLMKRTTSGADPFIDLLAETGGGSFGEQPSRRQLGTGSRGSADLASGGPDPQGHEAGVHALRSAAAANGSDISAAKSSRSHRTAANSSHGTPDQRHSQSSGHATAERT
ncbi:hypothetical protein [Streptomyces sp. NPDC054771]